MNGPGDVSERTQMECACERSPAKAVTLTLIAIIMGKRGGKISRGTSNGLIALQLAGVQMQTFVMISLHHVTRFYSFPPFSCRPP